MGNKHLSFEVYSGIGLTSSKKVATPFEHTEIKKSLEAIVSNPESPKKSSPLENMFSDKSKSLKASVNALLEEIRLREDINLCQVKKMNKEVCRQHTELMELDNLDCNYPFGLAREISDAKDKVKGNVLELEREMRKEEVECWRDLMGLKKYLMVSLKDYWELERKRGVLSRGV